MFIITELLQVHTIPNLRCLRSLLAEGTLDNFESHKINKWILRQRPKPERGKEWGTCGEEE